jgi:hypothetical protein
MRVGFLVQTETVDRERQTRSHVAKSVARVRGPLDRAVEQRVRRMKPPDAMEREAKVDQGVDLAVPPDGERDDALENVCRAAIVIELFQTEHAVLHEDGVLEFAEAGGRFHAKLTSEHPLRVSVGDECLALTPAAVQGEH